MTNLKKQIKSLGYGYSFYLLNVLIQVVAAQSKEFIVNDNPLSHLVSGKKAAVASENPICSRVGLEILKEGGNAVDSAIASALCVGTINSFASGIGGGGFMLIRTKKGKYEFIDFRETAPGASTKDMYAYNSNLSQLTGLSVSVPGEIRGFELAHQRHGKLPWSRLFRDSILIAKNGFRANELTRRRLETAEGWMRNLTEWTDVFAPKGRIAEIGDIIKRPNLAKTLDLIARRGASAFYEGPIAKSLVRTIRKAGGIITLEDLRRYQAIIRPVISTSYHGYNIFTTSAPTSGPILLNVLNIIEPYHFERDRGKTKSNVHRLAEALKFGYAARTELGDPSFIQNKKRLDEIISKKWADFVRLKIRDDRTFGIDYYEPRYVGNNPHGTMHLSVVDKDNSAVSLTSTINLEFGSRIMDPVTGIILNNEQDDFSSPGSSNAFGYRPSPANFIAPYKRPLSSTTPTIIEDPNGELRMVVGASGGSRILTSTINAIINKLDFDLNIFESVATPRIHEQLSPNVVEVEYGFSEKIIKGLIKKGHEIKRLSPRDLLSAVQSIYLHRNGKIDAASDPRKGSLAAAY